MTTPHPGADDARAQIADIVETALRTVDNSKTSGELVSDAILSALTSGRIAISQGGGVPDDLRRLAALTARNDPLDTVLRDNKWKFAIDSGDWVRSLLAAPSLLTASPAERDAKTRRPEQISWTAREAFAIAYCWAEFTNPQDRSDTPEAYWLRISERSRNECRRVAGDLLLLAVARGDAVAVLPSSGLRGGEFDALKAALGLTKEHRVRAILDAVRRVFKRDLKRAAFAATQEPSHD